MEVTTEMLQAAMKKATEAGLLPRNSSAAEAVNNMEIIQAILQAALSATHFEEAEPPRPLPRLLAKSPARRSQSST